MSNDLSTVLLALATESAELRRELAIAQDLLTEIAIDGVHLPALHSTVLALLAILIAHAVYRLVGLPFRLL